jgi:phage gp45-like
VQVDCDHYIVNATQDATFNTPVVNASALLNAQTVSGAVDVIVAGKSTKGHRHKDTQTGLGLSGTMA